MVVSGMFEPEATRTPQIARMIVGGVGALIALWRIFAFVFVGKGTPAPFDPPRRLVIRGAYRFVRNPMYIGAELGLASAAISYQSISVAIYAGLFFSRDASVRDLLRRTDATANVWIGVPGILRRRQALVPRSVRHQPVKFVKRSSGE